MGRPLPNVKTERLLHPIAFGSRELRGPERNYWPTKLEMAGVIWTARKLKPYLEMTKVEFVTDHQANEAVAKMKDLSTTSPAKQNLRLQSWAIYLSQFWDNLEVTWHKGAEMECPDALSRLRQQVQLHSQHQNWSCRGSDEEDVPSQFGLGGLARPQPNENPVNGHLVAIHVQLPEDLLLQLRQGYEKDRHLGPVLKMLLETVDKTAPSDEDPTVEVDHIPFRLEKDLLFFRSNQGLYRLAIPEGYTKEILRAAHDDAGHM